MAQALINMANEPADMSSDEYWVAQIDAAIAAARESVLGSAGRPS